MTDDDADSTRHVRFTAFTPTGQALLAALAP
jgi:hypothetical protein